MDESTFDSLAKAHRNRLFYWLALVTALAAVSYSVKEGSVALTGWQANLVYGASYAMFGLSALATIAFAALLVDWFRSIGRARLDRSVYEKLELVKMWPAVFGPIPWR